MRTPRQFLNDCIGVQAFERGEASLQSLPVEVHLQLAATCNLSCVMCSEHIRPLEDRRAVPRTYLSPELFEKVAAEILPWSSQLMLGVGGEAMLSPHFLDFARRARELHQEVHLMTNGTRIASDETARAMVRDLAAIEVSVDAAQAGTYERIRRGSSFERLLGNLERLNRFRMAVPEGERPRLSLCMVLMRSNVRELPGFVELAGRLGAERVSAWHVIPVTPEGQRESLLEEPELADGLIVEARARAEELGVQADLPRTFAEAAAGRAAGGAPRQSRAETIQRMRELDGEEGPRLHCHMPSLAVYVLEDGSVHACGHPLAHSQRPMGNLNEQGFAEIWNGRAYRNLRAGLAGGDPPALCRGCSIMHSPPPAVEEPGEGLARHHPDRDLAPAGSGPPPPRLVEECVRSGLASRLQAVLAERDGHLAHAGTLTRDRDHLRDHAANLEGERRGLLAHIENLEAARGHLERHRSDLEAHLARYRSRWIHRIVGRVKWLTSRRRSR